MTSKSDERMCKLTCKSFFCSKRMLRINNKNGKKTFLCTMDNIECLGYMCNYAECRERKMTDSGQCLRPVISAQKPHPKKQTTVMYSKYDDYMTPDDLDEKIKKKLSRSLK